VFECETLLMSRHAHTSQAFIPMGKGDRKDAEGGAYIVIGCLNGKDDKPDLSTLRAFLATSSQGVSYDQGIWRELSLCSDTRELMSRSFDENCRRRE
jgi:allantoicase